MFESSPVAQFYAFLKGSEISEKILAIRADVYKKRVLTFILMTERLYPFHPGFEDQIRSLSKQQLESITTSPHVGHMLLTRELDVTSITTMIHGERERHNEAYRCANVWTALGDRNFGESSSYTTELPLDFDSPWLSAVQKQSATIYTRPEQEQLAREIQNSLDFAREMIPDIYKFILEFTRVLQIRRDRRIFQYSTLDWTGRIYLGSPKFNQNPIYWLDILFHESIHNCLYLIEEAEHLFAQPALFESAEPHAWIASPWTGASIDAHSYAHATLVWYGLWVMSRRLAQFGSFSNEVAVLQSQSSFGFRKRDSMTSLFTEKQQRCLNPNFRSILTAMQDEVLNTEKSWGGLATS